MDPPNVKALRKHSLNAGSYHPWGDVLSQLRQKPSGYQSHYKPDSSGLKQMAKTLFLGSWIPHPNINEGQGVNENFEEAGGGIFLKRAPVMFQVPLPPRENLSLWKSRTWEAKRTMTEHLEARRRAWGALLPQSSRCGFCRKEQAWGCLGSYPIELSRRMQRPQYRRSGGVQPDAQGLRRILSQHPEECFL